MASIPPVSATSALDLTAQGRVMRNLQSLIEELKTVGETTVDPKNLAIYRGRVTPFLNMIEPAMVDLQKQLRVQWETIELGAQLCEQGSLQATSVCDYLSDEPFANLRKNEFLSCPRMVAVGLAVAGISAGVLYAIGLQKF